jgi:hypothetical protein
MVINSIIKKSALAVLIAFCSVMWLSVWHEFGYGARMSFPAVSSLPRDTLIILLPVMLAVWGSTALAQWLINRSQGRMSPSTQSILTAAILGGMTSIAIILMEATRVFRTGISNEVAIQVSLCRRILLDSSFLLKTLLGIFPNPQAMRYHVLLQDGIYLALINLGISVLLIFILEGAVSAVNSRRLETARGESSG